MSSYAEHAVDKYLTRGILVDTNLLLLYVVGQHDEQILVRGSFNRLAAYDLGDFRLLCRLISLFPAQVTTPYVLAEVSNWVGYLPESQKHGCLASFLKTFREIPELAACAHDSFAHRRFRLLGLTDTAIAAVANDYLVVTDDARFAYHLAEMGLDVLNINHLRQAAWLAQP